tara:strand:- start:2603 stop:4402 length:1800 start_codon:yes stop_codon:yes gene_type:complete
MAAQLQIKRAASATANSAPSGNLAAGELAVSYGNAPAHDNGGGRLFVGNSAGNGNIIVGGEYFTGLLDHAPGTLTNGSAIITNSSGQIDTLKVGKTSTAGIIDLLEGDGGSAKVRIQAPNSLAADVTLTLPTTAGSNGQFLQVNGSGQLSFATVTSSFTLSDGSNTDTFNTGETLTFTAGEGTDITVSNNTVTIVGELATTSNAGVASFASADFAVSGAGEVTIHAVSNAQLAGSIANAKLASSGQLTLGSTTLELGTTDTAIAGLTQVTIDNVDINGNTISTTDTDGNLVLDPNGSGAVNVNSSKIINVTDPTNAQDAATKAYVDASVSGLDVKESVRIGTTAALDTVTYSQSAGTLTRSGNGSINDSSGLGQSITLTTNDRVLVKDQAETRQNGIYVVTTVGSGSAAFVLTRASDANVASEITGGTFTFVEEGTNADNGYVFTHDGTPTINDSTLNNNTQLTVSQFSGAGQITAGTGLTKSGNTINVVGGTTIDADANAIHVNSSGTANQILLSAGTVGSEATYGALPLGNSNSVTGTLTVANGGSGATSLTANGLLVGNGTSAIAALAVGTSGHFLKSNGAGSNPSFTNVIDAGTF